MKPAARRLDYTTCPTHGAGTIERPCARMVNINGMPAAHLADTVVCEGGAADLIDEGASTVLIEQLPAARMGDGAMHGGVVMIPCSANVNIGGPKFSVPSCFRFEGDGTFRNKTLRDIWFLSRTRNGQALFRMLESSGHTVTIAQGYPGQGPRTIPGGPESPGDSTVIYDPDRRTTVSGEDGPTHAQPQLQLFHELVHSARIAEGRDIPDSHYEEEAETIARDPVSENALREELGLDKRDALVENPNQEGSGPTDFRPGGY
jgi:uncharacterized Zn-binding protein involved in type VI secretion